MFALCLYWLSYLYKTYQPPINERDLFKKSIPFCFWYICVTYFNGHSLHLVRTNSWKGICECSLPLLPILWLTGTSTYVIYISNVHSRIAATGALPVRSIHVCYQLPNFWWGTSWSLTVSPTKFKRKLYLTTTIYSYFVKNR